MATGGDLHDEDLESDWMRVYVSFLRIVGAALWAAFTAIVTNYLLRPGSAAPWRCGASRTAATSSSAG